MSPPPAPAPAPAPPHGQHQPGPVHRLRQNQAARGRFNMETIKSESIYLSVLTCLDILCLCLFLEFVICFRVSSAAGCVSPRSVPGPRHMASSCQAGLYHWTDLKAAKLSLLWISAASSVYCLLFSSLFVSCLLAILITNHHNSSFNFKVEINYEFVAFHLFYFD